MSTATEKSPKVATENSSPMKTQTEMRMKSSTNPAPTVLVTQTPVPGRITPNHRCPTPSESDSAASLSSRGYQQPPTLALVNPKKTSTVSLSSRVCPPPVARAGCISAPVRSRALRRFLYLEDCVSLCSLFQQDRNRRTAVRRSAGLHRMLIKEIVFV